MGQYTGELIHYLIRDIADVGKYFFAGLAAFFAAGLTISVYASVHHIFVKRTGQQGRDRLDAFQYPWQRAARGCFCPGKCPAVCSVWCIAARGLRENEAGLEYIMYGMCSQSVH